MVNTGGEHGISCCSWYESDDKAQCQPRTATLQTKPQVKSLLWLSLSLVSTQLCSPLYAKRKYHCCSTIWKPFIKQDTGLIKPEDWNSLPFHSSRCTLGIEVGALVLLVRCAEGVTVIAHHRFTLGHTKKCHVDYIFRLESNSRSFIFAVLKNNQQEGKLYRNISQKT